MQLLCVACVLLPGQETGDAQRQLDAYYAKFAKAAAVTGSLIDHGRMMGRPYASVFAVKPRGVSHVSEANLVSVSDGQSQWIYSVVRNQYIKNEWPTEVFGLLYGPRFAPLKGKSARAATVERKVDEGQETLVFRMDEATFPGTELIVDNKTGLPLEVRVYGNQGIGRTEVAQTYVHDQISDALFQWRPPATAKQVESLRDETRG